jgi:hypothetical protein
MSRYSIYKSYPKFLADTFRRYKNKSAEIKAMLQLNGTALVNRFVSSPLIPNHAKGVVFKILYGEQVRESTGNHAVFLSESDTERLLRGKYTLDTLPVDLFPYPAFTVCFPSSFEVHGKKLPGAQVSFVSDKTSFLENAEDLLRKLPDAQFFSKGKAADVAYHENELTISYVDHGDEDHTFLTYRGDTLLQVINSDNFKEFKKKTTSFTDRWLRAEKLDDKELERQYVILRAVLGMCVYIKARPQALQDGFPKARNFSLSEPFGVPTRSMNLNLGNVAPSKSSPNEHYRSWHIRQLSHERYYQNEHKDLAPGSRLVFVSDTMVNSTATVKNIENGRVTQ